VGRNGAIKRYDATPAGQPLELFDSVHSRRPVIVELLRSPWIVRASELARRDGGGATKRVEEPLTVEWDAHRQCPISFVRANRRYVVDAVVQVWASERRWWDPRRHVSRRFFRVLARGGVYDLAFDRAHGGWSLTGIQD
jgi:hypothetical protein